MQETIEEGGIIGVREFLFGTEWKGEHDERKTIGSYVWVIV